MSDFSFERDLLDVGGVMKRGKSYLVSNGGKIIALITFIVSVIVMFTDISFSSFASYSFFTTLLLMLFSSYHIPGGETTFSCFCADIAAKVEEKASFMGMHCKYIFFCL